MKKYILSAIAGLLMLSAVTAQDAQNETPKAKRPSSKQERLIFDFGLDSWAKLPVGIKTDWLKSRRFEFYYMKDQAFAHGHLGIAYGLGMSFTNVNSNASYDVVNGNTILTQIPDSILPSQNKLSTNFLEIPIELRFRTSPLHNGNRLKLAVGVKAGWLMQDHIKYQDGGVKIKTYNTANLDPFRFAYTVRLGYGKFSLMGYYAINPLFKKGKGSDVLPFGVGIAFTPHFGGITE